MRKGTVLELPRAPAPEPPPDRGPLMDAGEIARDIFRGKRKAKWVRENVPNKIVLGHSSVFWYRNDVLAWIASQRESA